MSDKKLDELSIISFDGKKLITNSYKVVTKNWGLEHWIINNRKYCMKILTVNPGKMCSIHFHIEKDETFHIVNGYLQIELWHDVDYNNFDENKPDNVMLLWPGSSIHIKPGTAHRFRAVKRNKKPVQFIETSTTHRDEDSIRLVPAPPA